MKSKAQFRDKTFENHDDSERFYKFASPHACFVTGDGFNVDDISQGNIGNCWFISALASLIGPTIKETSALMGGAVDRVMQPEFNKSEVAKQKGLHRFKFFKLGKFADVIIDTRFPSGESDRAFSSGTHEWWIPLVEKAYAKFSGSYKNIIGGLPGWGLVELTGGVAIQSSASLLNTLKFDF